MKGEVRLCEAEKSEKGRGVRKVRILKSFDLWRLFVGTVPSAE